VVALIHPCLYDGKKCPSGNSDGLDEWVEQFVFGVAYYKSGRPKNGAEFRKARRRSGEWIRYTSRSVNETLGACPGPYPGESLKFLSSLGAVTLPNPALEKCGQRYLEEIRRLPEKCKSLARSLREEWSAFEKKQLRKTADILRCDPYCLKMLCRTKDVGTVFTRFSGKPTLLIGDGACEGKTPKMSGGFLREALPKALRTKLEKESCLPPGDEAETSTDDSTSGLGNGPEVQLVE
jgi:hypothetical protein